MRKHALLLLCSAQAVILGVGCSESKPPAEKAAPETRTTEAPATPATEAKPEIDVPPGEGPVATINGEGVDRALFNREYVQTMERYHRARHEVKPALRERLKDNIVRRLIDGEIIRQQAKKMAVQLDTKELEEKWSAHRKRYGSDDAFQAFLERAGTSAEDVKRQFEMNLLREKVFARVSSEVAIKPEEVKAFYDENPTRYDEPEQVRASHILIRTPRGASEEEQKKHRERAEEVLRKAKAKGADFAALATQYGEDPTKDRGGDLGFFTQGRMVKPFEEAVWNMKEGEISGLVETQFGFHIIKKTGHTKARKKPFAEVKAQIERTLLARKRNQAIRDALNTWKEEAEIEVFVKGDPEVIAAGLKEAPSRRPELNSVRVNKPLDIKQLPKPELRDDPAGK